MSGAGRPLRFLGAITGGWVGVRILLLWQETGSLPEALRQVVPLFPLAASAKADPALPLPRVVPVAAAAATSRIAPTPAATPPMRTIAPPAADPERVRLALLAMTRLGPAVPVVPVIEPPPPPVVLAPVSRWSGSGWLIARDGMGLGAGATSPQLGGAQAGVRIDYAVAYGFALTGRVASPAAGAGREVSVGVAWRPAGLPIRIVAERRVALDAGRGGTALGVSGGLYQALPGGFRLEGYAQAGVIARAGLEHYADGILRAARPVASFGKVELDLGVGAWGGAQRGVARLDVGPSIGVAVPLADRTVRLALDWRQRVAGDARPGSGPALSIGSDF